MRVVVLSHHVVARTPDGGWAMKNRMAELVAKLPERGWEVTLVARTLRSEPFLTAPVPEEVRLVPIRSGLRRPLDLLRVLALTVAARHVLLFMPSLMTALLGVVAGRKTVIYAGSAWTLHPRGGGRLRGRLESLAAARAGTVITAGDAVAGRFRPVARAVETAVPLVAPEVAERLRTAPEASARESRPLRLLYVGSINPLKGVDTLADALEDLPDVECRLAGPPGADEYARRVAAAVDGLPAATMLGYLDWAGLREQYRWADVLVLPSHTEGFPRVAYEATAFGAALVLTPVGGIPHRMTDGADALLVPVADAAALRAAIERLANDEPLRASLAAAAGVTLGAVLREPDPASQFDRALRRRRREPRLHVPVERTAGDG